MSHEDAKRSSRGAAEHAEKTRVGQSSPRPPTTQETEQESSKRMLMEEWKILTLFRYPVQMAMISHWAAFQKPSGDPLT
jgi:hypothetical protein